MPVRVVACVIERDGKFLLCRRPAHKRHGGLWEFPGGKVEDGETHRDAAIRELWEELGVRVTSVDPVRFTQADTGSAFEIDFVRVRIEGEPKCLEHVELAWAGRADAEALPLAPSDRAFIAHLESP